MTSAIPVQDSAVDRFVQDAEQFDDLTMLCLEYKGNEHTKGGGAT